jgi:dimethylhistidine N-methyltransferase
MDASPNAAVLATPQHVIDELSAGLLQPQAITSPKYLFEAITELPEYYPTRTERAIVDHHMADIARRIGANATLVDLGAGNCEKASRLFKATQPKRYVALDISADFLHHCVSCLSREYPDIEMHALASDLGQDWRIPSHLPSEPRTMLYPGSSIGNFTPDEALTFLKRVHRESAGGGVLIGVDVVKPKSILEPAYDDSIGVTAAFNLNMLAYVNRLIGANFDVRDWQHRAVFNEVDSRIEMHLVAKRDVQVHWQAGGATHARAFASGEYIHTENSYKYTPEKFAALLQAAGFQAPTVWTDSQDWFAVMHASAA